MTMTDPPRIFTRPSETPAETVARLAPDEWAQAQAVNHVHFDEEAIVRERELDPELAEHVRVALAEVEGKLSRRFDSNFVAIETAIMSLRRQKPPRRPRRTGSAARMDPDDYRAGRVILAAVVAFAAAMGAASFFGQIGFAPNTQLPPYMWWVIPVAIDLPLTVLGWVALIFRRRKQSARRTWAVMFLLTAVSSALNITHVLEGAGVLTENVALTFPTIMGCVVMGLIPFLIVYSWEEITKLLVKPTGEERDEIPPNPKPQPVRRPTPRKKK